MSEHVAEHAAPEPDKFWLSDKWYSILKWITQIVLPAAATLYLTIGGLWNLAEPEKVAATIVAVDTFLGVVLMLATNSYNKSDAKFDGAIDIQQGAGEGTKLYSLSLNDHPDVLDGKDAVVFKVNKQE
jgi:hypothetical protein